MVRFDRVTRVISHADHEGGFEKTMFGCNCKLSYGLVAIAYTTFASTEVTPEFANRCLAR
jgi:hypothetical protein